ncbi:MAG: serine/threonine-protein kinase [Betaproteobacteria bacterium]
MHAFAERASRLDWQEIFTLLDTALDLESIEHAAWIEALPAGQARLSPMLKLLLHAHADVGTVDFLRVPATLAMPSEPMPRAPVARSLVGPYRLLREIGQGGMASVWLAERSDGLLERQVALKLPHVSWGLGSFAERMVRERNILGSLTHPNIARLYDAGLAADGRPFLALEYVDGQPIDAYATAAGLTIRARVELIVQMARAVAHAHARLIVHRDLKPSNIVVDAQGRAHLLDFGIAKLVDPQFADVADEGSQLTQATVRVLTPDYASPEHIRGDPIGTASDIYSLGVVMFELLAGVRPYRLPSGLGPAALAEAIARVEVPRASITAGEGVLRRQLSGDLDAILAKALAKFPGERYATMDALADDLERHLRGEAVQARPAARWYLAERWVRRHKIETAVALGLLLALLGGAYAQAAVLVALGVGALVALWQRNRALREAERARAALARAEQVKNFIASIFTQAVPRTGHGGAVTAVDLLRAAARRVETDLSAQPEIAAELSALIGTSFIELGDYRAALEWMPKVVQRCTLTLGATHYLSLNCRRRLVEAANSIGELSVSEPLLLALVSDLRDVQPAQTELLVHALKSQAFVHTKRGRETAAMAALNEAVEIAIQHFGPASELALGARGALSNTFMHFGRAREALAAIEPALAPARAAFGAMRPHPMLLVVERFYGDALARDNRPREGVIVLRQVLAEQRALDAEETARVRIDMTLLLNALMLGGHFDEAEALVVQSEALHERLTGGVNDEGITQAMRHSLICALRGDGEGAVRHLERADALAAATGDAERLASDRLPLRVLALATAGRSAKAVEHADAMRLHVATLSDNALVRDTALVRLQRARAFALRTAGSPDDARAVAENAVAVAAQGGCTALEHGLALAEAAHCLAATGAHAQADLQWRAALSVWDAGQVDGPEVLQPVHAALALLHARR